LKKVVIVSGIQIINNPRVVKEANALTEAGFDVTVIGAVFDRQSWERIQLILNQGNWKHIPVVDLSTGKLNQKVLYLWARLRFRFWRSVKLYFDIEATGQLGYFPKRLYRLAKQQKADLYIVHLEQALWAGVQLLKDKQRVAADFEDWYSEDCLEADRKLRPGKLMRQCEEQLLRSSSYTTTTSTALSVAIAHAYDCRAPSVVYNSFPIEQPVQTRQVFRDRKNPEVPSIIWFSQTIGPGRGLEQLVAALEHVSLPFELHIRGTPRTGYCAALVSSLSERTQRRIFFHEQVPQHELLSRLGEHDIGYCGEARLPRNKNLTIANKILEYLRAGLAIVASSTQGHLEVAEKVPQTIHLFELGEPATLVNALEKLMTDVTTLANAKAASNIGLRKHFDWSGFSERLVQLATSAIQQNSEKTE
jgi:glycosyltransferase involved in cell wall biosynthesis